MQRLLITIALVLFNSVSALAQSSLSIQSAPVSRNIDLNAPGAMDKVQASDPTHYKTIQSILDGLNKHSVSNVPRWIQTTYRAKDVGYSWYVRTSYPGQTNISFTLDKTRYFGVVTLDPKRAQIYPVKAP